MSLQHYITSGCKYFIHKKKKNKSFMAKKFGHSCNKIFKAIFFLKLFFFFSITELLSGIGKPS